MKWLRLQQAPSGLCGTAASHDFIYDHAIASYAMCEAYGLSNYKLLRKIAQGGINYLESHRNPYACWRYQPRDNDNRACYAVLEDHQVTWHRVPYDYRATMDKILATGVLSEMLARRLQMGK